MWETCRLAVADPRWGVARYLGDVAPRIVSEIGFFVVPTVVPKSVCDHFKQAAENVSI